MTNDGARPKIPDLFKPGKKYSYEFVNTNFVVPNSEKETGGLKNGEIFGRYDLEHMFGVYLDKYGIFRENLNSSFFAPNLPDGVFSVHVMEHDAPWSIVSWEIYETTRLAWLLMKLNGVKDRNIFDPVKSGTEVRYLDMTKYIGLILDAIDGARRQ